MARVIITNSLKEEMLRKFKSRAAGFFQQFKSLEDHPQKGKAMGQFGGIVIKELKCDTHRFYFITDGHVLKFGSPEELARLLIKFVRLSGKNDQQKVIDEIKDVLSTLGFDRF
jgi:hypothetical protein